MADGFFAGGMAEGMQGASELGLKRDSLAQEGGLRTRALDLQHLQIDNAQNRDMLSRADAQVDATMKIVGDTISEAIKAGKDPVAVQKAIAPLVDSAKRIAQKSGRDPQALDSQVIAQLFQPTTVEAAKVAGEAAGTKNVAQESTEKAGGYDSLGKWKTLDEKAKAEATLRDDFTKQAQSYVTIRDSKNRLDNIKETGAGDIALLFQFMKILDPGSTVREGEFATAGSVAGVPGQIEALRKQVLGDGRLSVAARKQVLDQANALYQAAALQHDKTATRFAQIAQRLKLDPNNVVLDYAPAGAPVQPVSTAPSRPPPKGVPAPPPGFVGGW